jgi:hypothetical protein
LWTCLVHQHNHNMSQPDRAIDKSGSRALVNAFRSLVMLVLIYLGALFCFALPSNFSSTCRVP